MSGLLQRDDLTPRYTLFPREIFRRDEEDRRRRCRGHRRGGLTKYPAEKIRGTAGVVRELCGLGQGRARSPERPTRHDSQSSYCRTETRENSRTLCVTKVQPLARAVAAISRSFGPIGVPARSSSARKRPYSSAQWSSKGRLANVAKNPSRSRRLSATRELLRAPKRSSALTIEDSRTCDRGVACKRSARREEVPLSSRMQALASSRYIYSRSRRSRRPCLGRRRRPPFHPPITFPKKPGGQSPPSSSRTSSAR